MFMSFSYKTLKCRDHALTSSHKYNSRGFVLVGSN